VSFVGMVIEEVEQLSAAMRPRASEIEQLIAPLISQLESTHWVGPDHEQFHGDWHRSHIPALRMVPNGLNDAANLITATPASSATPRRPDPTGEGGLVLTRRRGCRASVRASFISAQRA